MMTTSDGRASGTTVTGTGCVGFDIGRLVVDGSLVAHFENGWNVFVAAVCARLAEDRAVIQLQLRFNYPAFESAHRSFLDGYIFGPRGEDLFRSMEVERLGIAFLATVKVGGEHWNFAC